MRRWRWFLKQLFPLHYCTISRPADPVAEGRRTEFVTWRMWFGRCFAIDRTAV